MVVIVFPSLIMKFVQHKCLLYFLEIRQYNPWVPADFNLNFSDEGKVAKKDAKKISCVSESELP